MTRFPIRNGEWRFVCLALVPILAIAGAKVWADVAVPSLLRDPSAYLGAPPLTGFLSMLGGMVWAGAVALWAALPATARSGDTTTTRFALAMASLTAYLAADDMFLLHEAVLPSLLHIPESAVIGTIGVATVTCVLLFRHRLASHRPALFALAVLLLSSSVAFDVINSLRNVRTSSLFLLAEDGCKWLGICGWCAYAFSTLAQAIRDMPSRRA